MLRRGPGRHHQNFAAKETCHAIAPIRAGLQKVAPELQKIALELQ
jgi:NADH:ubiquinone oxidoreductase subunit F (NADH-binding)